MKRWYVVQAYAGYEEAATKDILKRVEELGLQDAVGEVVVPAAKVKSLLADSVEEAQQLFPGYVLIEMEALPEVIQAVTRCARVIGFLGGRKPVPLSQAEVDRFLAQMRGEVAVVAKDERFAVGDEVEILEGPFSSFVGIVDKVDADNEKLAVMVSIFGRMTPVELGFDQVKR